MWDDDDGTTKRPITDTGSSGFHGPNQCWLSEISCAAPIEARAELVELEEPMGVRIKVLQEKKDGLILITTPGGWERAS